MISDAIGKGHYRRDRYGINPVIHSLETSLALCRMVSPDRNMVLAVMLYNLTAPTLSPTTNCFAYGATT